MTLKTILIVDDDERFADLINAKLSSYAQCMTVSRGESAVLLLRKRLKQNKAFDAIIMDIEMPVMDGHETVQKLRELEEEFEIPVDDSFKLIMLTAHKDVKNVSKSFFKSRADAYIPKEKMRAELISQLDKLGLLAT